MEPLLQVRSLRVVFPTPHGAFEAISDLDLDILPGERLALMGESGCGKSVLGHAIMGLMDGISDVSGSIRFRGRELQGLPPEEMRKLRGGYIALVPQSPRAALDPVLAIGRQVGEMAVSSGGMGWKEAKAPALSRLRDVGFNDPEAISRRYPHQLSGGMCERAVIAMGTLLEPSLLIADEPTKGLDPASKMDIIDLLLKGDADDSLLLITHDYYVAAACGRVAVMYSGEIVEDGPAQAVLTSPRHPYVKGLWKALPANGLAPLPGAASNCRKKGCRFMDRCLVSGDECTAPQVLKAVGEGHRARCCHA